MITPKEIEELTGFKKETGYTVSVYLNTDRKTYPRREYLTSLKDLVKRGRQAAVKKQLNRERLELVSETLRDVQSYAEDRFDRAENKGLAVFASREKKFFKAFPRPVPVKDGVFLEPDPYLKPLLAIISGQKRIGTILVDHSRARIFETCLGQTESIAEIADAVPGQVKTSGWHGYGERIHRKTDDLVLRHLKNVAQKSAALFKERRFDLLVLAGLPELTAKLARELPANLKERVAGFCHLPFNAPAAQVQAKSIEVEAKKEKEDVWKSLPK